MAGLTPFQFSSNKLQNDQSIGDWSKPKGNSSHTGLLGDTYQTMASWYEMWINPQKISLKDSYINQKVHTAGGLVTFHYRKDVTVLTVEGVIGWVQIQSDLEAMQNGMFNLLKGDTIKLKKGFYGAVDSLQKTFTLQQNTRNVNDLKSGSHANKINNSPRKFLERLKTLADEPMYYYDSEGVEHYNIKYIKMYTKQYPTGVICEGYFTDFTVPESSDDAQTIDYNFTFIIENKKPVTLVQKVAGMFSGAGSVVGGIAGMI
jgi:preprotein translocase subunit YajC